GLYYHHEGEVEITSTTWKLVTYVQKRGIFNFVGELSKILFGTLDEAVAAYYKTHIDRMEARSEQLLKLSKEQVAVVRATLTGLNRTVESISSNLLKVMDLDVFVTKEVLGYVINIPLIENNEFNLYKMLPLPVEVTAGTGQFTYIQPEKEYLLLDRSKKLYAKVSYEHLECKEIDKNRKICKQTFGLISMYDQEDCEVKLLQESQIPTNCVKKMISLERSLWTRLSTNEWLYIVPKEEGMTILCSSHPSQDVKLLGRGIIKFKKNCKGYGTHIYIQSDKVIQSNYTRKDIIPDVDINLDC
ncbi:uncharacterized protein LOC126234052, partial [Schistocerca nitens]|uniref:uncharacterized protein LOC126234052 n=1 Tax=Schistocerca nitens TaxID=7011 RepID=UPI00211819ED